MSYIDSHLRCPHCSKRMMLDLGQDDDGQLEQWHECWSCDYRERAPREVRPEVTRIVADAQAKWSTPEPEWTFDGETFRPGGAQ